MKTREGFVSNSSSTSFCCLGFPVEKPDFGDDDIAEDNWYDQHRRLNDEYWKCEKIWDIDNDNEVYSLNELNKIATKIAKKHNISKSEIKLFIGTVEC